MTAETIARLRITLEDIHPAIWRRVEVPTAFSLKSLHDVIQAAFGWEDRHLWHFEVGEQRYGLPNPDWPIDGLAAARNIRLAALVGRNIATFTYTYDMGDDWRHRIAIETVEQGQNSIAYPRFVDGERQCPPEDVGGLPGFERFLDALADPNHPDHHELQEWHGGPFDPESFNHLATKRAIGMMARRRSAAKAAYAKRRT
jgi:hypothetical protein